jgi:hypothetical protein
MSTRDIIDYAVSDNAVEFRNAMYAAIHDRVTAAIESKKQEIAQNLVTQSESVEALDELSKKTLGSYTRKASSDRADNAWVSGRSHTDSPEDKRERKDATRKEVLRQTGIGKAVHRLSKEEVELQTEESGQFRLVSKHGEGKHTAKVYKDREWGEYRVRHYRDGKHIGEDSDSHHDDLKDAQGSAEANIEFMDKNHK